MSWRNLYVCHSNNEMATAQGNERTFDPIWEQTDGPVNTYSNPAARRHHHWWHAGATHCIICATTWALRYEPLTAPAAWWHMVVQPLSRCPCRCAEQSVYAYPIFKELADAWEWSESQHRRSGVGLLEFVADRLDLLRNMSLTRGWRMPYDDALSDGRLQRILASVFRPDL